uniref:histidine kinase n=2 Tax=Candidatus Bipolaricaulota TaxID=67810 RepID=H5SJH4_9BACT|nr:PAS/PAC sensor hybrid histidine kinase [uncultured Acetothermia bacterium]BAL60148.1 PAS/PAC sensor hybrid histidine kinase [Candidatus Acetothermum autotrophicum]
MARAYQLWRRRRSLIIGSLGLLFTLLYLLSDYLTHPHDFVAELTREVSGDPWLYIGLLLLIPLFAAIGFLLEKTERERQRFETLFETAQDGIYVRDLDGRIKFANSKFLEIHGVRREDVIGKRSTELLALPRPERKKVSWMIRQAVLRGEPPPPLEAPFRRPDGSPGWIHVNLAFIKEGSQVTEVLGISRDITERKRSELLTASRSKILELSASGAPLSEILETICRSIEELAPGVLCSILLLEGDKLRHGAAPSLPQDYNQKVDGLTIGPTVGSCGTAAYLKKQVIVSDTLSDPLWADFRDIAKQYGLRACWSTPILSQQGEVLGTFAMYYREPRSPSAYELELIQQTTHLTALVLERRRTTEALHRREQVLRAIARIAERLLSASSWEECAHEVLRDLGQATRVSRVYIFENHRSETGVLLTSQRFEWVAEGVNPQIENPDLQNFDYIANGFARWVELLSRGEPIVGLVRELPHSEQEVLTAQQIKAILCVPIFAKGAWWGFIGFDECTSERIWSALEVDALKVAANVLGSAIERTASQVLLRASEARYRSLFESVPIGLYRSTPDGHILDANEALVQMLGYPGKEALLETPAQMLFFDINERQRWQAEMDTKGIVKDFVTQLKRYDGTAIWVVDRARTVRDPQGKVLYYDGSLVDITEQVRAQEALRASEARYRALVESSPDGIAIHQDGRCVFINPAGARLLGAHKPEELLGKPALDFVHPDYREAIRERVQRSLAEWQPAPPLEERFIRLDGTVLDVEVTAVPVLWEGRPAMQVIFRDISERKRMEADLKASEERYRDLFENANDGIYILDRTGRILSLNRKAQEITGYTLEEIRGQLYTMLVPSGPERKQARRAFLKNMRGQSDKNELTIRRKDGREVVLELSTRPIWQNGQIIGIQGIGRDVTERKELERLKSEFISTVSHELRTPLTSIKGYVDLVLAEDVGPLTPEQREFLTIVAQNTTRLTELINDLLEIERLESGRIEFEFVELSLEEVLQNVARSLQVNAEQKGLEFVTEIASGLKVRGDRERLAQVFLNLLSNAIKYTPAGTVELKAYRENDTVVVAVRDTGIGLSESDMQKLFQKFFRADNPYVRKAGGTGLGLSIAKAIVERHNGTITVTSQLGQGSTFTVRLPALARPEAERPLVLVIEDEVAIARLIATYIEKMGYRAVTAYSAREGFERAVQLKPHLITLDVLMPDLDGFALIQQLKKHPETAHIPVIFLSIVQDKQQGLRLGASAFLTKPIDERKFYETVRALLEPQGQPVLVVDDDRDYAQLLQRLLQRQGFSVEIALDGDEALRKIRSKRYQLVILDKNLPRRSGLDVLQEMRRSSALSRVPVIFISGSAHAEEAAQAAQILGAKKFLSKKLAPQTLVEEIVKFLEESQPGH